MRAMKIKNIFIVVSAYALISSCEGGKDADGYETAESGLLYKFYTQNEQGVKPQEGDYVQVIMNYKTSTDSVMFDSRMYSRDGSGAIEFPLSPSTFKGSFEDALGMMRIGDSASFRISADSLYLKTFKQPSLPPNIEAGSMLTFEAKLLNVKTKDVVAKEMEEKKQQQMLEMAKRKEAEPQEIAAFVAAQKITVKPTETGLYYVEVEKGKGEKVVKGKTVQVKYTGKFLDGKIFDSSEGKPTPFEFEVGASKVIPGWDEAMLKMNIGGKAMLVVPSALAYGEMGVGQGLIPPYTPLTFDVEVVSSK